MFFKQKVEKCITKAMKKRNDVEVKNLRFKIKLVSKK